MKKPPIHRVRRVLRLAWAASLFGLSSIAAAQTPPERPGPYVLDARLVMSGLPASGAFHPALPTNTLVPRRGFGGSGGGHVYLFDLGPSRVGLGLDLFRIRGTSTTPASPGGSSSGAPAGAPSLLRADAPIDITMTMTAIAPQISFNFGSRDGWSYLSGGYGTARIRTVATGRAAAPASGETTAEQDSGSMRAVNYGGGARWFLGDRMAVGFDVRFYRMAGEGARPRVTVAAASVGLSFR